MHFDSGRTFKLEESYWHRVYITLVDKSIVVDDTDNIEIDKNKQYLNQHSTPVAYLGDNIYSGSGSDWWPYYKKLETFGDIYTYLPWFETGDNNVRLAWYSPTADTDNLAQHTPFGSNLPGY